MGACAAPRSGRADVLVEVRSRASLPLRSLRLVGATVDAAYLSTTQSTRSTCIETSSTFRGSRGPFTSHRRPFIARTRPLRRYTRTRPQVKEHARCPWRRGTCDAAVANHRHPDDSIQPRPATSSTVNLETVSQTFLDRPVSILHPVLIASLGPLKR